MTLRSMADASSGSRPLKVVQVVASVNRDVGGPATSVPMLASSLQRIGVDCPLAAIDDPELGLPLPIDGLRYVGVPADALARRLRGWSPALAHTVSQLVNTGADIVHNHGLWMFPNLYARRAATRAKVPLVISPRGMLDAWSLEQSAWKKALVWRAFEHGNLRAAAAFHATSEAEAAAIRALGLGQPIAVIHNGVDPPRRGGVPGRGLLEQRFPELLGSRWLLFLSRLHPKKGVADLLHAWRAIEASHADWRLVIAGPDLDGYGEAMRTLARELGLGARTTFTGMLSGDDRACALGNADLFVLPTHSENFGIVIAEALAHGVPAITTKAAPWARLQQENCGWWIEDDEGQLGPALEFAMRLGKAELGAMGARGREMVARSLSWDRVAKDMLALYGWLSGFGDRPACVAAEPADTRSRRL